MEVEKAFKRLLVKNPFYGLFCLSLPKEVTRKTPTLGVTKQGISCCLQINPDFWAEHTDDEQIALLQHELSHIALQHVFLHESFADKKIFNISADAEVNSYIENLPKDGVTPQWISQKIGKPLKEGIGTKKYYEEIQDFINKQQQKAQAQNPQQPCNGGQGGQNSQSNSQNPSSSSQNSPQNPPSSPSPSEADQDKTPQEKKQQPSSPQQNQEETENTQEEQPQEQQERGNDEQEGQDDENQQGQGNPEQYPEEFEDELESFDDHSSWKDFDNQPESVKQLMQNNINTILKNTAEQVEKMHGTIPGEFTELIEKLRKKQPEVFNWKAYFRRLLGSIYDVNIRSTRRKQSKRFAKAAGIQHKKKVSILVAVDTSCSVCNKELQEFFSEIDYVYKAGARVTIVECDTRINSITEYDGKNLPEIKGRGGTDFNPPVDYYYDHRKEYASLIYFTDGEAPLPSKSPQGMVWVISSLGSCYHDFPGKIIRIPKVSQQQV